ncbi:deoxyribonuclease IV [bacterium LRH843]|nr:deoxyribonuclease IV [bacterium LRH843]
MRFGCHLSIREGYAGAAKRALAMNAAAFQYFPKNPRSLEVKDFNRDDAKRCKEFCAEHALISVSHSPYPTSLTPQNEKKREQVVRSLLNDLTISETCGSIGVVVHFGKQMNKSNPLASYHLMIDILNEILQEWEGEAKILLENNASSPGTMGTTLEEHVQIRNLCDYPEKIGFCFDTCHAFASDLWGGDNWDDVVKKGMEISYFDVLKLVHFNNSKYEAGSGKDRHAPIFGPGYITEIQFDKVVNTPQLAHIPFILETPKNEITRDEEIKRLWEKWG